MRIGTPLRIEVEEDVELKVVAQPELAAMYHLSPYVWQEGQNYAMLLRVVNRSDVAAEKIARIHFGTSQDGLTFSLDDEPVLRPGPQLEDADGCEDPTVCIHEGNYFVYYTGWNEVRKEANLLYATGDSAQKLAKHGFALHSHAQFLNPKEATLDRGSSGWRLFFEYSSDNRSHIGIANGNSILGPWNISSERLPISQNSWNRGMLSPGPIVRHNDRLIMFYNGAINDDHWKIGWVSFDEGLGRAEQSEEPLLHGSQPEPGARDMAFSNSAVRIGDSRVWLYYSVADMQMRRATIVLT